MKTAIVILAAGKSSRMGRAKQLLAIGNKTLLVLAVESAMQSKADKTYCVLGAHFEAIQKSIEHYSVEIIMNANYHLGLSSSIIAGLKHLEDQHYDSILIMLADQPKVDANYLNQLIEESIKQPSKIIASSYSGLSGVPAVFPKIYYNELLNLKGDKGAKVFLNSSKTEVIQIDSIPLIDIDTADDYSEYLNSL